MASTARAREIGKKRRKDRFPTSVFVSQRGFQRCFLRYALALSELPPTTDTQKGNSLHCMVENSTQSQIFRYGRSIFCLPHRPNFSNIFGLCLHWVSVVHGIYHCIQSINSGSQRPNLPVPLSSTGYLVHCNFILQFNTTGTFFLN